MRILVVEDETMVARQLCRLIREIVKSRLQSLHHVYSLADAKEYLNSNSIDVLFLDLNLSGEDGFDLLSDMIAAPFQTIIASANIDQALRSYEYGVIDFVPKPFKKERLENALAKIQDPQVNSDAGRGSAKYLGVRYLGNTQLIQTETITHIQAAGKYSELFLIDDSSRLHEKKLKELLQILPPEFQQIHKSCLANLNFVSKIFSHPGSRYELSTTNELMLPVGRKYLASLRKRMA
jgi:two-component system response regulator LytT